MVSKLEEFRRQIDEADQQIIQWIEHRLDIVDMISIWKQANYLEAKDIDREAIIRGRYYDHFGEDGAELADVILGIA